MSTKTFLGSTTRADEEGRFSAIVSPFGGEPDTFGDVIDPNAYDRYIREEFSKGTNLPVLDGHNERDSTADIGRIVELEAVEGVGLYAVGQLDLENPRAKHAHRLMKERRRVEFSIGYSLYEDGSRQRADGATVLTAIILHEISLVLKGAARTELLAIKSAGVDRRPDDAAQGPKAFADELIRKGHDRELVLSALGLAEHERPAPERPSIDLDEECLQYAFGLHPRQKAEAEREERRRRALEEHDRRTVRGGC